MNPRINKLLDFLERVGWTAAQAAAASLLVTGFSWAALEIAGTAAGLAAAKVIVSQRVGDSDDGALPSPIEPPPKDDG